MAVHSLVMRIGERHYRTIWLADDGWGVEIIDQTRLPHAFDVARLVELTSAEAALVWEASSDR